MSLKAKVVFKSGAIMEVECDNVKVGKTKEGALVSIAFSEITKSSNRPLFIDVKEIVGVFAEDIAE